MARTGTKGRSFILIILTALSVAAIVPLVPVHSLTVTWSPLQRLTRSLDLDFNPDLIQTSDGKVWLFWETAVNQVPGPPPIPDIHYKTWDWPTWPSFSGNLSAGGSPEQTLASSSAQDILPSAAQLENGTLFVSFSSDRGGNFDIYLKRYNPASGWSSEVPITSDLGREETSSLLAASDGSLWVFWDRRSSTGAWNIYYKQYTVGPGWTTESPLTTGSYPTLNRQPNAYQMKDGRIWVVWSQVQDTNFSKVYVYQRVFDGTWLNAQQSTSTGPDRHPIILQDANSTIWMFWSRELTVQAGSQGCYQEDLFYKYSTNNGSGFSTEGRIMNDQSISSCQNDITPDDIAPTALALRDFKVWVFWASTRDPEGWWDIYYASSNAFPPPPVHDVAVASVSASPLLLRRGGLVTVNVVVDNPGTFTETLQLTVTAANTSSITIATRTVTLATGASASFTVTWDTSAVTPARYKISATVQAVPGESTANQANNSLLDGTVRVIPPGDVNYDGTVTIIDGALLAFAYDTRPGDANWNPNADLDYNGVVNIVDGAILAFWYGVSS